MSEQYFEAVDKWAYTQEMHNAIEDQLRPQRTARDVIGIPPLSEEIEKMKTKKKSRCCK